MVGWYHWLNGHEFEKIQGDSEGQGSLACCSPSVQFSCSVLSHSLRLHEPQQARPRCPSPTPGVHPNPCPSSWWCHPTISSSVIPFSSCPQSFPVSGSFQMNQLFTSGGQSIGVSASTSVLPVNTQDWSPLGWSGPWDRKKSDTTEQQLIYTYTYTYPCIPFLLNLPHLPPPIHPSMSSQSARLGSLCYRAASHQLAVLHMIVYI